MSSKTHYTLHHPKWYRRPVSVWWWLESWPYTRFVLRELTSLPVAIVAFIYLWQVSALAEGPEAYIRFLERMQSPDMLIVSFLCAGAVLFHALTWFHLAPKAMTVRVAGKRIPDAVIVVVNYGAWLVISGAVFWVWLGS